MTKVTSVRRRLINNPEFIEKMTKLGQAINYMGGEEYIRYAREQEEVMKEFSEVLGWTKKK